jgi:predicted outer membrane lipoprotein
VTWLAWRQFRIQALTAAAAFVVLGAVLAYTGPHVTHLYNTSGIQACQASHGDCGPLVDNFTSHYSWWHGLGAFIIVIPALIGVFWGAPLLARELETGTHRLAWTQSVTRARWLATKVIIIGVASVITAAAFSVIIALWLSPFDKVAGNRFSPGTFSQRGIVPIAYTVFAFALGVAVGALLRRLLPAMVTILAGFAAVRLVIQQWVRPHIATPLHVAATVFDRSAAVGQSVWIVASRIVDKAGHTVTIDRDTIRTRCGLGEGEFSRTALGACTQRLGLHAILTIQPAHRYWPFQAWEFAIFTVLTVALIGFAFWWTRHRIT